MRRMIVIGVLCAWAGATQAQMPTCASVAASAPVAPLTSAAALPVAPELSAPADRLGAPSGVLAHAYDDALSVERVLLRLRLESCRLARATPARPAAALATDPAAYKPRTQYDNTPWRFDMNQNGKRMTADEFDAWMKARGVRVAKGAPPVAPPPPAPDGDGN